ncbi:MAG: hypothetical protein AAF202_07495, partial [Pseudomonadota bacterium]
MTAKPAFPVFSLIMLALASAPAFSMVPIDQVLRECRLALDLDKLPDGFMEATHLKPEQAADFDLHVASLIRSREREQLLSEQSVYAHTGEQVQRQTQWTPQALAELQNTTGWSEPFGVSYDPATNKTRFLALGDTKMVQGIRLRVFESAEAESPYGVYDLEHQVSLNEGLAWLVELEGPMDGVWYDFEYSSVAKVETSREWPVPEKYKVVDPVAPWSTATRARVYFPPAASSREPRPESIGQQLPSAMSADFTIRPPTITLEL